MINVEIIIFRTFITAYPRLPTRIPVCIWLYRESDRKLRGLEYFFAGRDRCPRAVRPGVSERAEACACPGNARGRRRGNLPLPYLRAGSVNTHGTPLPISPGCRIRAKYLSPRAQGVLHTAHASDVTILICGRRESAEPDVFFNFFPLAAAIGISLPSRCPSSDGPPSAYAAEGDRASCPWADLRIPCFLTEGIYGTIEQRRSPGATSVDAQEDFQP